MKRHITRRDLRNFADALQLPVYQVGYCGVANLLRGLEPFAYNSGIYGWNWDAYKLRGCIICTGYRNLVGKDVDYDTVHTYEKRAAKLTGWGYDSVQGRYDLLQEFEAALLDH